MKMSGPYRFEMKVAVTNDDGTSGEMTLECGLPGTIPTAERVQELLKSAEDAVVKMLDGGRLMNKPEFFNFLMEEKTGVAERWATPGGDEWENP